MNMIKMPGRENTTDEMVVGLPRALLYFRYRVLWETFFRELGVKTTVSPETNLEIMRKGAERSASEMCMAMKIYMGHVDALRGKVHPRAGAEDPGFRHQAGHVHQLRGPARPGVQHLP